MGLTSSVIAMLLASASLGAMLFFSAVVAPTLFGVIPEEAGRVLRALFPRYFVVNGIAALVAAGFAAIGGGHGLTIGLLAACGLALLLTRMIMVPIINAARDRMMAGDATAKPAFDRWHRASVLVNLVEMAGLVTAITLLSAAVP